MGSAVAKRKALSAQGAPPAVKKRFDDLKLEETIGFLLSDASRTMTRTFSARIAAHGVGMGIFQFLRILWEEDGLSQSELASRTHMRGPSVANAIHDLERRGLVKRVADAADGHKVRVLLTREGRRLYDLVMPHIAVTNKAMLVDFTPAEQEILKSMLRRIRCNLADS
jgi:hypothetical protein